MLAENKQNNNRSYNNLPLSVGDEVYVIVGKHLKAAVIEEINQVYGKIKVKGIKTIIKNTQIIKI